MDLHGKYIGTLYFSLLCIETSSIKQAANHQIAIQFDKHKM